MKKILVVVTSGFVKTGGLTSVMMNYWRVIDKKKISFDFASSNKIDNALDEEISSEGSKYFQLPSRRNLYKYYRTLQKLCKGYEIIHVHANSATSVIELLAAKTAGIKKRIHHNHTSKTRYPILNKFLYPIFNSAYTDGVACSFEAGKWLFRNRDFTILPNAIHIDNYMYSSISREFIRKEFKIKQNDFVIGHIGKFMEAKNHKFLINIFAIFHSNHPNSKLLLIGEGDWRPKIETWIAKSGCSDSIILAGLRSDINNIVQAFDVLVFPSIYEGLPLSVIEAQASGLPCLISSNVSSAVNIGKDVVMKDLKDGVERWAKTIDEFDYSVSRKDRSKENYNLLTQAHFNIEKEAIELLKLYNS